MHQRHVIIGFVILCVLAIAVFVVRSASRSNSANVDRPDVGNPALVARGKQLYAIHCASCHASDLKGEAGWPERRANGVMPASPLDGSGTLWQRDDRWIFVMIKSGNQATGSSEYPGAMPGFAAGLTDSDIWAVISYMKSSWPAELQQAQPPMPR